MERRHGKAFHLTSAASTTISPNARRGAVATVAEIYCRGGLVGRISNGLHA